MSWVRKQMLMFAAVVAAISGGAARGDTIVGTPGPSGGTAQPFGIPDTQTYGQTILAPTNGDDTLQSFTFYITGTADLAFRGEVYAWDGFKATGPALFESAPISIINSSTPLAYTINTGGVGLTSGQSYVLFVSSSKDNLNHSGTVKFDIVGGTSAAGGYDGGNFYYLNNGTNTTAWTSTVWDGTFSSDDLLFQADFNSAAPGVSGAPLPRTAVTGLGLLGLAGMMLVNRRRLARV